MNGIITCHTCTTLYFSSPLRVNTNKPSKEVLHDNEAEDAASQREGEKQGEESSSSELTDQYTPTSPPPTRVTPEHPEGTDTETGGEHEAHEEQRQQESTLRQNNTRFGIVFSP